MNSGPTLSIGSTGHNVRRLQRIFVIARQGFYHTDQKSRSANSRASRWIVRLETRPQNRQIVVIGKRSVMRPYPT
jgi:hypothetical protein